MRPTPLLDVPVVPCPHEREREVEVGAEGLESEAAEAGEVGGEAERRVDAVEVHVGHPCLDVPGRAAHVGEVDGLAAAGPGTAPNRCVEADVGEELILEEPRLLGVVAANDARRAIGEPAWEAALEHAGRLYHVVVD